MKFSIKDRITTAEPNAVLSYALDYRAEFEVDDEWADKVVTARFVHSNGEYIDVVLDDFGCNIPLFPKGVLWVGAYTDAFTSTAVPVPIGVTIKDLGEHEAIPPTADVYQQIIALIEAGRLKGDKGDPGEDYTITAADYQAIADRVPQPDLSEYVKNTDYATSSKGGVVKLGQSVGAYTNGQMYAQTRTASAYDSMANDHFIGKGTLENIGDDFVKRHTKEPQFELIEEITLTEGVANFRRTAEPNGNPYNFSKLLIKTTSANASQPALAKVISVNEISLINYQVLNGERVAKILVEVKGGRIFAQVIQSSAYGNNAYAVYSADWAMGEYVANALNSFRYTDLPTGTKISIYAVRG